MIVAYPGAPAGACSLQYPTRSRLAPSTYARGVGAPQVSHRKGALTGSPR